jgi:hypothetical protein
MADGALGALLESQAVSHDTDILRDRLDEHGYVYLRHLLPQQAVSEARRAVLGRLAEVDEVEAPAEAAIATGRSRRRALPISGASGNRSARSRRCAG